MLERYFAKPDTIDRIRACWIGAEVERYTTWLSEEGYTPRSVLRRVPLVVAFGEFARQRGAENLEDLPAQVEAFVAKRVTEHRGSRAGQMTVLSKEVRGPVEQFLTVVMPDFVGTGRRHYPEPFTTQVVGFFDYLGDERGLRPASIRSYRHHLDHFQVYLARVGAHVSELSPALLSAFVVERSQAGPAKSTVRDTCGVLKVFLRYAHREGVIASDLSDSVEWPQVYRLSTIPR